MLLHFATKVDLTDSTVGTAATQVFAGGAGTTLIKVINDHGSNTLYVGWDDSVSSSASTHFIGGDLAAGASITLENYAGPLWLEGSGATTAYRVERRYIPRDE